MASQQTVMLFARPVSVPGFPKELLPNRQLFDFARTHTLEPGASQVLQFRVTAAAVALVDEKGTRAAHLGTYAIEFRTGEALDRQSASSIPYIVKAEKTLSTLPEVTAML